MRIPTSKVATLAQQMVTPLVNDGDIETDAPAEVVKDVESVLNQYIRDEQEITERARDLLHSRRLPPGQLGKMKRLVSDERKIGIGDDAIDYILDQLVEFLMHSHNVEEIFAEDVVLRRKLREPMRRLVREQQALDVEVEKQLRHVKAEEGSAMWDVEYRRMMEEIRRRKGL